MGGPRKKVSPCRIYKTARTWAEGRKALLRCFGACVAVCKRCHRVLHRRPALGKSACKPVALALPHLGKATCLVLR